MYLISFIISLSPPSLSPSSGKAQYISKVNNDDG